MCPAGRRAARGIPPGARHGFLTYSSLNQLVARPRPVEAAGRLLTLARKLFTERTPTAGRGSEPRAAAFCRGQVIMEPPQPAGAPGNGFLAWLTEAFPASDGDLPFPALLGRLVVAFA